MANITVSAIANDIATIRNDPALVQTRILDLVEHASDGGLTLVDPNNPFALGLEMAAALAVNNVTEARILTRKAYPSLANTVLDVYAHMTDYDYRDVFTTPSRAKFVILLDKEETLSKTVRDPSIPGIRRLTIPRYTKITVADTDFTLLYPIDITLVRSGGIQITYDTTSPTRLQPLTTNLLKWDIINIDGRETIRIEVELYQLTITRFIPQLNASSGFSRTYTFSHGFHFCRAFIKNAHGGWQEITTTHSTKVYDIKKPTVILTVLGNEVKVDIPQIYFNNKLITDNVRLDFYTTKGPMNMVLESMNTQAFAAAWDSVNNEKLSVFSAPILTLNRFAIYSIDTVSGGRYAMPDYEIRRRVITRSLNTEGLPITHEQLANKLTDRGYLLVTNIDNITDRQFLATRRLPPPSSGRTITGISASIATLEESLTNLELSRHVIKNNFRSTIKPTTIYEMTGDKIRVVDDLSEDQLKQLRVDSPETFAKRINERKYMYSPYYYVIDSDTDRFGCRIYDLDNPRLVNRYFNEANASLGTTINVNEYSITPSPNHDGYYLDLDLNVGQLSRELGPDYIAVQLSYLGKNASDGRYWINGVLQTPINPKTRKPYDDIYIYRFHIETRYDVDETDGLIPTPYMAAINLEHEFDVVTVIKDYEPEGYRRTDIDQLIRPEIIPKYSVNNVYTGVSHEKIRIKFGDRLKHLWGRTRTIVDHNNFEVHEEDVIDYFSQDVFEYDETGNPIIEYDRATDELSIRVLHKKGDRRLDMFGDTVYKYRKGQVKLDDFGDPILKGGKRGLLRHIELFLLDARYLFSDNEADEIYRNGVRDVVTDWCVSDMAEIDGQLLERSEIFFYPMRTTGRIDVLADDNLNVGIDAEQRLKVTFWLTETNYNNTTLRDMIEAQCVVTIQNALNRTRCSTDTILDDLRLALDGQIVSVILDGFAGGHYNTVTLKDGSIGLSVGKKLHLLSNNTLEMRNDVEVVFKIHGE